MNTWYFPLRSYRRSAHYGQRGPMWSTYHTGEDFLCENGSTVYAVADGKVVEARATEGKYRGYGPYGKCVAIDHGGGIFSFYAHLSGFDVETGDKVLGGTPIGKSGSTGNTSAPHLHFEVRKGANKYLRDVDPNPYLADARKPPRTEAPTTGRLCVAGDGVLYARDTTGALYWYRHLGADSGAPEWANDGARKTIGSGWALFHTVVAAGNGVIYAVRPDGALCWYRHVDPSSGEAKWANDGQPKIVGSGWQQFTYLTAGSDGVLYAVRPDGGLVWYRHQDTDTGAAIWAHDGQPRVIGSGWQHFTHVTAADNGVIYAVRPDGTLCWYRHVDPSSGEAKWANDGQPKVIGSGWQHFIHLMAAAGGLLYAVKPDGALCWYRHLDPDNGESTWANDGQAKNIGTGWTY